MGSGKKYIKLFQPGMIGSLEVKNRLIMAPMATRFAKDGAVTDEMLAYYVQRAKGGVGGIVVEAAIPRAEGYISNRLNIGNDRYLKGLRALTKLIHESGVKAILQLNAHRGREDDIEPLSPSDAQHPWKRGIRSKAAPVESLKRLIADLGDGAKRAREASFDGVMIHFAHGYLACEFLSPLVNKRTDEYGGKLENRARFGLELVRVAREKTGDEYPVIVRMSASERLDGGFSLEEAISVCQMLERERVSAIDVVSGFMDTYYWTMPCMRIPRGCNVELAGEIKKAIHIPVMVAGRINTPQLAEEILEEGKADFLTLGRALLADPEFPNKAKEGREGEIRQCIACMDCMNPIYRQKKPYLNCAVNPAAGEEINFKMEPAERNKKILVVGGGPAGMEAAIRAASRGHRVTLWEKSRSLGGQLNMAILPPHKEEFGSLLNYFERECKRLGILIELNKEGNLISILAEKPDALILATGSSPFLPKIPGIHQENVVMAQDVLTGKVRIGARVIILGGGLLGCEMAEFLADRGKRAIIVEVLSEAASEASLFVSWPLLDSLKGRGVEIVTGVKDEKVVEGGLEITDKEGKRRILYAEHIIVATGTAPDKSLYEALKDRMGEVYAVGDCLRPGRIWNAIHEGAAVGLKI